MKIKNYVNLWAMSLLILSINQIDALEKMSQDDQEQVESEFDIIESEEFPPYSTDQYVYAVSSVDQPTEPDVIIEPTVISDVITNNYLNSGKIRTLITQATKNGKIITTTETWKTKNSSYLTWSNGALVVGAVGAVALAYLGLQQQRQQQEAKLEEILKKEERYHGHLTSDEQKIRQDRFDRIAKKFDVRFDKDIATNLIEHFSDEQFNQLLKDMEQSKYKYLEMNDFSQMYEKINRPIKLEYDKSFNKEYLKFGCKYQFWGKKYCTAAHEAGHSLVTTQNSTLKSPGYATVISLAESHGHTCNKFTDTWTPYLTGEKNNLDAIKHGIKVDLAGGIAMAIAEGKKLTFDEFLAYEKYGMGNSKQEGTDIYYAYERANNYFKLTDKDSWIPKVSEEQRNKDVFNLLKQSYEETVTFLNSRKDQLAQMTNQLYDQGIISDDTIHEIAGTTKPKYFNEMSPDVRNDIKNASLLKKVMTSVNNFNEENPYEIHDVLG